MMNLNIKSFIFLMDISYGIKEVTTPRQRVNGTMVFKLPNGELIGSYKSGYVRRCDRNRTIYQLNKVYKQDTRYTIFSDGKLKYIKTTKVARELIYGSVARLAYIVEFYKRNYLNNKQNTITQG